MITKEITDAYVLIKSDKITRTIALCTIFSTVLIGIVFSALSALIILSSYISGFVVCNLLLKYQHKASSYLQRAVSVYRGHFSPNKSAKDEVCNICSGTGCTRHLHNNKTPWKNIIIDKKLNDSVEHFFNRILDQFIVSWYENYTNDKSFVAELKHSIRYALAISVTRFLEIDVGKTITSKLVPCAIKHVDDYLCMKQIAELKNVGINNIAVEYLGKRLHVAASSRNNELRYLRFLASSLIERLLPPENLKCRNYSILLREILSGWVLLPLMDVLADPNIINSLVILSVNYKGGYHHQESGKNVELLCNFQKKHYSNSALASDLKTILKNPQLLYAFMQFLKKEGSVHILNFCLDIEAFNVRLLMPDLSKKQLEELHTEALNLYKVYLNPKSVDFIGCSKEIIEGLHKLLEDGVYNVAKLQTSEPLFQAYDFAFNLLESDWMPQFHHSNEFYNYICGSKVTQGYVKGAITSPFIAHGSPARVRHGKKYYEGSNNQGAVAKISSGFGKIKGALQTKQPIEGSIYPNEARIVVESDPTFVEEIMQPPDTFGNVYRDMSCWRVAISLAETHPYGSKPIHVFHIHIQRIDSISSHEVQQWVIQRREQDFYVLKAKLIEFHGENEICNSPLPARRAAMSLETRKNKYEEFLKKLLEKPTLKGSDLLHTFLTARSDFALLVTATSMPIVDLENIYQSVAYKLRKEKGQHLDTFMNTYLNSTGRHKPAKFEWAEMGDEIDPLSVRKSDTFPKTMHNSTFKDNFGVEYKKEQEGCSSSVNPNGITEATFYLLKHIFKVPNGILKLYVAICSVAQQAVESLSRMFIERKIKSALPQPTLAFLIKELEDVIFAKHTPSTEMELSKRRKQAFNDLESCVPGFLGENVKNGCLTLLTILQNPLFNKQLAYSLVDIVIAEIYPEFDVSEEFY